MTFVSMGGISEIHGPRAQLDKDGQIQSGLERGSKCLSRLLEFNGRIANI